jgi:AcrR family transcriptional regulator
MARPRSPELDQTILFATIRRISKFGYEKTTIEAIASTAGVGKTTVYRRWASKADLMAYTYSYLVPVEALTKDTGTLVSDLEHLLGTLFQRYRETEAATILAGLVANAQEDRDAKTALSLGIIDGRKNILGEIIERAQNRGEPMIYNNPTEVCDLIIAMVWHRLLTDKSRFNDQFVQLIINTIIPAESQK